MSVEPEQAMKRANATDSAEYTLSAMHARDYQERLAKQHPARWRLLAECPPWLLVFVTPQRRLVTIEAMAGARLLYELPTKVRSWRLTGWGSMVRDAGTRREAGVYTRTEAAT